jgi:AcrR family transcriptional regulator
MTEPEKRLPTGDKGRRTRERLLIAAEAVFADTGYLEARTADIAIRAGVSNGTFYTYFTSKEHIFRETAETLVRNWAASTRSRSARGMSSAERIRLGNRLFLEFFEAHAGMLAAMEEAAAISAEMRAMRIEMRRRYVERVERAIERIARDGRPHGLDRSAAATALTAMMERFAYVWFVYGEPFEREGAMRTLDQVWLRALGLDSEFVDAGAAGSPRGKTRSSSIHR